MKELITAVAVVGALAAAVIFSDTDPEGLTVAAEQHDQAREHDLRDADERRMQSVIEAYHFRVQGGK
jgi:hypothetical protein